MKKITNIRSTESNAVFKHVEKFLNSHNNANVVGTFTKKVLIRHVGSHIPIDEWKTEYIFIIQYEED